MRLLTPDWRDRAFKGLLAALLCAVAPSRAADPPVEPNAEDLTLVSLEELSQIQVTSVAKKQQSLLRAAAAVYVITAEDIHRSGATRIPEALRMAPGLEVAQIDGNHWAITARGFNGRFANKLLVMIDGRTIFNAFFSGVYWDLQDIPIEQIERIEVVRGPGATLWGANAVNGVINIITKSAGESQGGVVQAGYGTRGGPRTMVRYGGEAPAGRYVIYGRFQDRRPSPRTPGWPPSPDSMTSARGGFRYDLALSARDELQFDGSVSSSEAAQQFIAVSPAPPLQTFGSSGLSSQSGHVLGRWKRRLSDGGSFTLTANVDGINRDEQIVHHYSSRRATVDFQHQLAHSQRAELTWGLEYRNIHAELATDRRVWPAEERGDLNFLSAFLQEELELIPSELTLTFGTKLEQSTLGGFQPQPSARVSWTPGAETAVWASASRATRAPSWGERMTEFDAAGLPGPFGLNILTRVVASTELDNEKLDAFEAGLRFKPASFVSADVATFFNRYDNLRSFGQGDLEPRADPVNHLLLPVRLSNDNAADSYGVELSTKWRLNRSWRVTANHSYFKMQFKRGVPGLIEEFDHLQSPTHRTSALSSWDLAHDMQLDLGGYYVGRSTAVGFVNRGERIPAHVRADVRWQWTPLEKTRIELGVQNLFDADQIEFEPETFYKGSPVGRNVYGRIQWSF